MNRAKLILVIVLVLVLSSLLMFSLESRSKAVNLSADLVALDGHLTMFRVNEIGSSYGPPSDFIDAEVIVGLDTDPSKRFGFQLRTDQNLPVRQAMVDFLLVALENNYLVRIEYWSEPGKNNSILHRAIFLSR